MVVTVKTPPTHSAGSLPWEIPEPVLSYPAAQPKTRAGGENGRGFAPHLSPWSGVGDPRTIGGPLGPAPLNSIIVYQYCCGKYICYDTYIVVYNEPYLFCKESILVKSLRTVYMNLCKALPLTAVLLHDTEKAMMQAYYYVLSIYITLQSTS